jgi:DDE superfamily endonuclease
MWCIPEASAAYVACMEDVLDLYEQPYDPLRPQVCYDEWRRALIGETRVSIPAEPGRRKRIDYEYRRNGVAYLHMLFEPLVSQRHIRVTAQHTMQDFAHCMKWLVDEVYPWAEIIRVVLDNLATHKPAALYETFPPEEARRILRKLELHYTPKHASWLNMAEIELSVFGRTMKNYIPEEHTFRSEAQSLTNERNGSQAKVDWQFRSADARIKLKQLYPSISS